MSNENNTTNPLLNVELPPSVDNALLSLTDRPTKAIGNTIADVWYLVFGGLSHRADKRRLQYAHDLDTFKQQLEQDLSAIPPERRIEPSIQTAAQALDNSKYAISVPELRTMFSKLIASSADSAREPLVHPSFAESLKQMTTIDAKVLRALSQATSNTLPVINILRNDTTGNGSITMYQNVAYVPGLPVDLFCIPASLSSLSHLGLIEIRQDLFITNDSEYVPLLSSELYRSIASSLNARSQSIDAQKGIYRLTPLGQNFVTICT